MREVGRPVQAVRTEIVIARLEAGRLVHEGRAALLLERLRRRLLHAREFVVLMHARVEQRLEEPRQPAQARFDEQHLHLRILLQRAGQDPHADRLGERCPRQRGEDALLRRRVAAEHVPQLFLQIEMVEDGQPGFLDQRPQRRVTRMVVVRQIEIGRKRRQLHATRLLVARQALDFLHREIDVVQRQLVGRHQPHRIVRGKIRHRVVVALEDFLPVVAHQVGIDDLGTGQLREDHLGIDTVEIHRLELALGIEMTRVFRRFRIDEVFQLKLLLPAAQHLRRIDLGLGVGLVPDRVHLLAQACLHPFIGEMDMRVDGDQLLSRQLTHGTTPPAYLWSRPYGAPPGAACLKWVSL